MKLSRHGPAAEAIESEASDAIEANEIVSGDAAVIGGAPILRIAVTCTILVLVSLVVYLVGHLLNTYGWTGAGDLVTATLHDHMFWSALAVGVLAQAIDGALGMAYGVTSTTFLLTAGASPATASASVHIAELFTTGVSGMSHVKLGNVDKRLFLRLLVPGIIGAVAGVLVVTQIDGKILKPFVSGYLVLMGLYILSKAWKTIRLRQEQAKHVGKLALFGGFVDASGGGGWGPVVTTTLVSGGNCPRMTIGSVNFAEFFIALATAGTFALFASTGVWVCVVGLVLGGICAAPFAALMTSKLKTRVLIIMVGTLVTIVSSYGLYKALA